MPCSYEKGKAGKVESLLPVFGGYERAFLRMEEASFVLTEEAFLSVLKDVFLS